MTCHSASEEDPSRIKMPLPPTFTQASVFLAYLSHLIGLAVVTLTLQIAFGLCAYSIQNNAI